MHGSMSPAGGNQASRASTRRTVQAPPADPTLTRRSGSAPHAAAAPAAPAATEQPRLQERSRGPGAARCGLASDHPLGGENECTRGYAWRLAPDRSWRRPLHRRACRVAPQGAVASASLGRGLSLTGGDAQTAGALRAGFRLRSDPADEKAAVAESRLALRAAVRCWRDGVAGGEPAETPRRRTGGLPPMPRRPHTPRPAGMNRGEPPTARLIGRAHQAGSGHRPVARCRPRRGHEARRSARGPGRGGSTSRPAALLGPPRADRRRPRRWP
jgi:hypothetical protein